MRIVWGPLLAIGLACAIAPEVARAANPVIGISDSRFRQAYPAETLHTLRAETQVGVSVAAGEETQPWAIPPSVGVMVTFTGSPWYEAHPAAYARAALRLVRTHPNVREIQVSNEPDLCVSAPGFWQDCLPPSSGRRRFKGAALDHYLDVVSATHDALANTGVKVLGFGFSPPWHRSDGGLAWWDATEIAAGIRAWYVSRGTHELVPRCLSTTCAAESVTTALYPRPIMDGFAYHPYAGWEEEETDYIHEALKELNLPGGTPALWWTETGMDTVANAYNAPRWVPWCGSEADQARRVSDVLTAAERSPWVAGVFNFLLTDESDPQRFQTGLLRPDGSRKPAFYAFAQAPRG